MSRVKIDILKKPSACFPSLFLFFKVLSFVLSDCCPWLWLIMWKDGHNFLSLLHLCLCNVTLPPFSPRGGIYFSVLGVRLPLRLSSINGRWWKWCFVTSQLLSEKTLQLLPCCSWTWNHMTSWESFSHSSRSPS